MPLTPPPELEFEVRHCLDVSRQFEITALRAAEVRFPRQGGVQAAPVPMLVCYAFAVEMALKGLLLLDQVQVVPTHRLPDLFARLEHYTARLVENAMATSELGTGGVQATLESVSDAFAAFRDAQGDVGDFETCVAFLSQLHATCVELAELRLSDRGRPDVS